MEYLHFKTEHGNFGDDLNPWLWSKFFGDSTIENTILLGIGTMLFNEFPLINTLNPSTKKIVFGAGIRPAYKQFKVVDNTWDMRFLRGPLSAGVLENKYKFITDAAYAMRQIDQFDTYLNITKKFEIGLMPYFRSMDYFDWQKICDELGFLLISPFSETGVEKTINEIASCKFIITEAMHGAIVADILRVPWNRYVLTTPFTEGPMVSEFKWMDWLNSIELGGTNTTFIKFYRKTFLNNYIKKLTLNRVNCEFLLKGYIKRDIIEELGAINTFNLSKDSAVKEIDEKIFHEIEKLKVDLS